ncbi:hypothetical protein ACSBR1_003935 [Camellia fascicularis]
MKKLQTPLKENRFYFPEDIPSMWTDVRMLPSSQIFPKFIIQLKEDLVRIRSIMVSQVYYAASLGPARARFFLKQLHVHALVRVFCRTCGNVRNDVELYKNKKKLFFSFYLFICLFLIYLFYFILFLFFPIFFF